MTCDHEMLYGARQVFCVKCGKTSVEIGRERQRERQATGCTCGYPTVVARNMNGHDPACPVYIRWRAGLERAQEGHA